MPQTPYQGSPSRMVRAWLALAILFVVMGGILVVYNPVPGGALLLVALLGFWRAWRNRPPAPQRLALSLRPDPDPGALGGHVGGWIHLRPEDPDLVNPVVTLACHRLCQRQRSQIIEHRRECLWRETRPLFPADDGRAFGFCFSPPAGLPATESTPDLRSDEWCCQHYWTLTVAGQAGGRPVEQGLRLTVRAGTASMAQALPGAEGISNEPLAEDTGSAEQRLKRRLSLHEDGNRLVFRDGPWSGDWTAHGRGLLGLVLLLAGLTGTGIGAWLLLIAGLWLGLYYLFRFGRGLEVTLEGRNLRVTTDWSGRPLFARHGRLEEADQLTVRAALLSGDCELFLRDGNRRLLLARALPEDEASALRTRLSRWIDRA